MITDKDIIEEILDEICGEIRTCAIHTGYQPKENCTMNCDYYHICQKIFEKE